MSWQQHVKREEGGSEVLDEDHVVETLVKP